MILESVFKEYKLDVRNRMACKYPLILFLSAGIHGR